MQARRIELLSHVAVLVTSIVRVVSLALYVHVLPSVDPFLLCFEIMYVEATMDTEQ